VKSPHHAAGLRGAALALWFGVAPLIAGEGPPPKDTTPNVAPADEVEPRSKPTAIRLQPALISVAAKQGGMVSFNEQEPSKLLGGVRLGYEEAFVLCDHVHYWQSRLTGLKRAVLDHALIASGPDAEEPEHVVFDTRASKLPQISFRGIMRPHEIEIIRQPLAPEDEARLKERSAREKERAAKDRITGPAGQDQAPSASGKTRPADPGGAATPASAPTEPPVLVRFRVLMHRFGDFSGDLQTTDGWAPHFGWADEVEVLMVGDLLPDGVANPRFAVIDLFGRPAGDGVEKRPARLGRKHIPLAGDAVKKEFGAESYDWWAESSRITVEFDDQGRVLRIKTGADYRGEGTPSLDTPVQSPETAPPAKP
jgi:hypothetical protein